MARLNFLKTFCFLTLLTSGSLNAQEPSEELFQQANSAYEAGQFGKAQELYERLVSQGLESPELYFNAGNTYFRLGRLGKARLFYERAKRLKPGDDDISYNLKLTAASLQDSGVSSLEFFRSHRGSLLLLFTLANLIFFGILCAGLFLEREWIWWGRWISGLVFLGVLALTGVVQLQSNEKWGIVLEPRAEVRVGPGEDYKVGFTIPEGQKIVVFQTSNAWTQIGVPSQSLKGWVPTSTVGAI